MGFPAFLLSDPLKELENQLNQIKMSVLLSKQAAKEAEDTPRAYWLKKGHNVLQHVYTVEGE